MKTNETATTVSLEEFRQRTSGKRLVLLYPWTNYRTLFLAHFLENSGDGLIYYRVTNEPTTLSRWLTDMVNELEQGLDGFGAHLRAALPGGKPAELGEALAADLGAYPSSQTVLYIDELDRVPFDAAFSQFVQALIPALPDHVQIAVNSRLLNYMPWYTFVEQGQAVVLGTELRKDDVIYTVTTPARPRLEVYSLGRGHALVNGQPITNWDGALPRNLFFYFVDHPLVTRDEIFATFWPELSVKEATNVFHVTKRKISERIGMKIEEPGSYELTQYSTGFYIPSEKLIRSYDVNEFQASVEKSMTTSDEKEEENLLLKAVDIYRAPFLQDTKMPWMNERRDQLRQLHAQALIGLGRINKRRGDHAAALGYFIRSLKETPEREDIHREVMNLYLRMGMKAEAIKHYHYLADMLQKTLHIKPSRETQELFRVIESS